MSPITRGCYQGNGAKLGFRHGFFGFRRLQVNSKTKNLMCPCAGVQSLSMPCQSLDSGSYKATRKMMTGSTLRQHVHAYASDHSSLVRSKPLCVQGLWLLVQYTGQQHPNLAPKLTTTCKPDHVHMLGLSLNKLII